MAETTIYVRHRNPGAALDLTIPVHLLVNVPDEVIEANVRANTRRAPRPDRIRTAAPHGGVAVMVGSGPSMKERLGHIRSLQADGGTVFAMNGAASFLGLNGITADYQVLVDARERTAELIGPAKAHLFASQCDPACFDRVPDARMWHFINGDLEGQLPADEPAHAQIGGAGSVGNCALALAWAMGFRRYEIFGYDSSHKNDASHAFHQPLNDFEPWGRFAFNGREYICSYTMRSQASRFQSVALALIDAGSTVAVHGDGILPDMWRETWRITATGTLEEREALKYQMAWDIPDYRVVSPAMYNLAEIKAAFGHPASGTLIDFGCGAGRGAKAFADDGLEVLGIDHVNALEVDIPLHKVALWKLPDIEPANFGICCDVMEHIPPEKVADVLDGISRLVRGTVYFSISCLPDQFSALVGKPLHLSVHSPAWWVSQMKSRWRNVTVLAETEAEVRLIVKEKS